MTLHTASALADFPSFSEGLSLRESHATGRSSRARQFPFLFGGTFIEGGIAIALLVLPLYFPSFSEGLSLREAAFIPTPLIYACIRFPFLFGGTFIEGVALSIESEYQNGFPFLFGGTFIEGINAGRAGGFRAKFPFLFGGTFIEGSRLHPNTPHLRLHQISLPFRRDFH